MKAKGRLGTVTSLILIRSSGHILLAGVGKRTFIDLTPELRLTSDPGLPSGKMLALIFTSLQKTSDLVTF